MENSEGVYFLIILLSILSYVLSAYVMYRIGRKLNVDAGLGYYFIPIYNMVLLCRGANINPWIIVGMMTPYVNIIVAVYFWGKVAEALQKNFWLYGLGSIFLLGIPILVLAFGSDGEKRVIEGSITDRFNSFDDQDSSHFDNEESIPVDTISPKEYQIHFISGELAGNSIDFNEGDILIIGRDPSLANIIINNQKVSRQHLKIYATEPNTLHILDMGSSNGSYFHGEFGIERIGQGVHGDLYPKMDTLIPGRTEVVFLADKNVCQFNVSW